MRERALKPACRRQLLLFPADARVIRGEDAEMTMIRLLYDNRTCFYAPRSRPLARASPASYHRITPQLISVLLKLESAKRKAQTCSKLASSMLLLHCTTTELVRLGTSYRACTLLTRRCNQRANGSRLGCSRPPSDCNSVELELKTSGSLALLLANSIPDC